MLACGRTYALNLPFGSPKPPHSAGPSAALRPGTTPVPPLWCQQRPHAVGSFRGLLAMGLLPWDPYGLCRGILAALCRGFLAAPCRGILAAFCRGILAALCRGFLAAPCRGILAATCRGILAAPCRGILAALCRGITTTTTSTSTSTSTSTTTTTFSDLSYQG